VSSSQWCIQLILCQLVNKHIVESFGKPLNLYVQHEYDSIPSSYNHSAAAKGGYIDSDEIQSELEIAQYLVD
jgi:hypothetical protein